MKKNCASDSASLEQIDRTGKRPTGKESCFSKTESVEPNTDEREYTGQRYSPGLSAGELSPDLVEARGTADRMRRRISELEAEVASLEASNLETEALYDRLIHELMNHLNGIGIQSQFLSEICPDNMDADCGDYVKEIYRSVIRTANFIESFLDFSRLSRAVPDKKPIDLSRMAYDVAMELMCTRDASRIDLYFQQGIMAYGDDRLLRIVMENLLGIAFRVTGMKELAVIGFGVAEKKEGKAYFVSDNGNGFKMSSAARIFAPFQRLPDASDYCGDGISLAAVERIVRSHGGRIWAESEPGKGATFFFTLPTN